MKVPNNIPETIKEARNKKALTQLEVGTSCGYSGEIGRVTVARWEAGSRPVPLDKLRILAKTLGIKGLDLIP